MDKQVIKVAGQTGRFSNLKSHYEGKIREHPLRSAAIALGLGVVTGAVAVSLMNRKHRVS